MTVACPAFYLGQGEPCSTPSLHPATHSVGRPTHPDSDAIARVLQNLARLHASMAGAQVQPPGRSSRPRNLNRDAFASSGCPDAHRDATGLRPTHPQARFARRNMEKSPIVRVCDALGCAENCLFASLGCLTQFSFQIPVSHLTTAPAAKSAGSAAPCAAGHVRSLVPISRTAASGAFAAEGVPPLRSRCRR